MGGIIGCAALAAACAGIAIGTMAISAGVAAAQSYSKYGDLRRAGMQAGASLLVDFGTGLGAGKLAVKVFGASTGIGRTAIDMHGAPIVFGFSMGLEAGIDGFCDGTKGTVC